MRDLSGPDLTNFIVPSTDALNIPKRHDGAEKATGAARFAGEEIPEGTLHAALLTSPVAKGRITGWDVEAARASQGVTDILLPGDLPYACIDVTMPNGQSYLPLTDARIHHEGQPIAIVLASTVQAARAAANLLRPRIASEAPVTFDTAPSRIPRTSAEGNARALFAIDGERGDFEAAFAAAEHCIDRTYETQNRHHNMMEPHATVAEWRDGSLFLHSASQWVQGVRLALSTIFALDGARIHVTSPYVGGGFGAKGFVWPHHILAAAAARMAGAPVRLICTREDCFTMNGFQPQTGQRMRLAATAEGHLTGLSHSSENISSRTDEYIEYCIAASRSTYASETAQFESRIRQTDINTPTPMRAPHEGPGMFALETAMDELAEDLGLCPLELRLRNHADSDPDSGKPYSSKKLREAYREGARRIGWERRHLRPRMWREGHSLIGLGMATATMATYRRPSEARLRLKGDGALVIEAGVQEIGQGVKTVLAQIVAERLGMPEARITASIADTGLPNSGSTSGSSTTLSAGSAVARAADAMMARIIELAGTNALPPPGSWPELLAAQGLPELVADGRFKLPGEVGFDAHGGASDYAMQTFGATFVEIEVDEALGRAWMRRVVGCYSAGRILSPLTARSQMIGNIVWGYGRAMLEHSAIDPRHGRFVSKNLSGTMIPVNADITSDIDVCFIDEHDAYASDTGAKGIGELGEVGVAAAITNAIHNATGRRIRSLPVTIPDLVG